MATLVPPTATAPPHSKPTVVPPEKVDYLNLPCPIPYEEIHREALMSFKPELFEGMRFDFTKGLNQKFSLSHSVFMGPTEIPSQSSETIKIPTAHYEFGANFIDPKLILFGTILTDVSSRFHYYKAQWCFAGYMDSVEVPGQSTSQHTRPTRTCIKRHLLFFFYYSNNTTFPPHHP
ncbi:hypothetical protein CsSME_00034575 [Camellia sinensis var. sinensis]